MLCSKLRLVGERFARGPVPVPVSATCCGLFGALSVRIRAPVRVPGPVGVKVTTIWQLAPGASDPGQLLVWEKSPVVVMPLMTSGLPPVLVRVTVWVAPVPRGWLGKERLATDKPAVGVGDVPVPVKKIVCGLVEALSVMVIDPVRVPAAVGVKVTEIVQLALAATLAPQSFDSAKSPLTAMLEMLKVSSWLFVKMTVFPGLVVPTF
jgi:hypothetical protein